MDPRKLPFNALIVGPTNSGKTQYLLDKLRGPFRGKFDYIVLFCPTFVKNKTYEGFVDRDPHIWVIACLQHEIEIELRVASMGWSTTQVPNDDKHKTLIILPTQWTYPPACTSSRCSPSFWTGFEPRLLTRRTASSKPRAKKICASCCSTATPLG